jgi:pSer/pThr/pTyr-binding forkhead associated (FHA) protein
MFIDSRRIKQHELKDGDVIQLGQHRLVYHQPQIDGEAEDQLQDEFDSTGDFGDADEEDSVESAREQRS